MSLFLWIFEQWAKYRTLKGGTLYSTYLILGVTTSLNVYSFRKDLKNYDLSLSAINTLLILPSLPWYFKCVFASISDTVPLCGYHRKSYMILGTCISFAVCMFLTAPDLSLRQLFGLLLLLQCSTVLADVNYDALVVEGCKAANSSSLQENTAIFRHIGLMIGMGLGPVIWQQMGSEGIYGILGLWYFFGILAAVMTKEKKRNISLSVTDPYVIRSIELNEKGENINAEPIRQHSRCNGFIYWLGLMKASFAHPVLSVTLFYYFFIMLLPGPSSPLLYFTTDVLKFSPGTMAAISILYELGGILGYWLYKLGMNNVPIRVIYMGCFIATFLLGFVPLTYTTQIYNPSNGCISKLVNSTNENSTVCYTFEVYNLDIVAISLVDAIIDGILATFIFNTLKTLIRIITKKQLEASLYSTVLSIDNAISAIRTLLESYTILFFDLDSGEYTGLTGYILFCQAVYFVFFLLFLIVPNKSLKQIAEEVEKEEITPLSQQISPSVE